MAETPTPRTPAPARNALSKLKGLPPWAYVAAVGVGGAAIWFGINRANRQAATSAADASGATEGTLSATTGGDAYPVGSQGAGYYYDPTTGTAATPDTSFKDRIDELGALMALVGGGSQPSASAADHYTPPSITVNIPDSAYSQPPAQAAPAAPAPAADGGSKPDKCKGEYPFEQDNGPRAGQCYKVVVKNGKRYRYYANGDKVLA